MPKRDVRIAARAPLFDHLVGAGEYRGQNIETERSCCFRINRQLEFRGYATDRSVGLSPLRMRSTYDAAPRHWSTRQLNSPVQGEIEDVEVAQPAAFANRAIGRIQWTR